MVAYLFGFFYFQDFKDLPTPFGAFRAWKMNFLSIWINVGVTALNLIFLLFLFGGQAYPLSLIILVPGGSVFVGIGAWLCWSIKQIWIM
jgi:hypothetical protein